MSEYIVNGAVLICDKGQYPTKLTVPVSRMCIAGKTAAHIHDCVPAVNIQPFGICTSGTYFSSNKAKVSEEPPCVLDLLDHYYLVDENLTLSDSIEIMNPLENCINQIRLIISGCVSEMTDIQHTLVKKMNYQINDEISKQYAILWQKTENVYLLCESTAEISQASAMFAGLVSQNCSYLGIGNEDTEIAERLNMILTVVKQLNEQAILLKGLPKVKEKKLVTTESFAVCRCGGIITFVQSGQ